MPAQHQAGIPAIIDRIEGTREDAASQANQATHAKNAHHGKPDGEGASIEEGPDCQAGWGISVHISVVVAT
jgi:hypothetical protein